MNKKRVRLTDIAEVCNVSVSTVSRALKGNPQIAPDTREDIVAEAIRQDYRTPQMILAKAQPTRTLVTKVAGRRLAVIEHGSNICSYFSEALREIANVAGQHAMDVVSVAAGSGESLEACLKKACDLSPDAIILITWANLAEAEAQTIEGTGIPTILLNRYVYGKCNAVITDDFSAGVCLARHFYNLGHRRIAHLVGSQSASTVREREDGFRSELIRLSCYDPDLFGQLDVQNIVDSINTWVQRFLHQPQPCTAIWAYNDAAAAITYTTLRAAGLSIPGDISIAGFDYMVQTQNLHLTTFDDRQVEMGRVAVNMAEDLLTGAIQGPVCACVVPTFVEGGTSGPVSSAKGGH